MVRGRDASCRPNCATVSEFVICGAYLVVQRRVTRQHRLPCAGLHVMSSRVHSGASLLAAITGENECWRVSRLAVVSSHLILTSTGLRCLLRVFIVKREVSVLCVSIIRSCSASLPFVEGTSSYSQTYAQIVAILRQSIG